MKKIKIEALKSVFDNTHEYLQQDKGTKILPQEIAFLEVEKIFPGEFQPREKFDEETLQELARSIETNGMLQPILVKKYNDLDKYNIIAGERRWRASKIAGISHIPCIVIDVDDVSCKAFALLENIQRDSLTPLEEAYAYKQLIEKFSLTHEEISKKTGKARTSITNSLRLLSLSKYIMACLDEGKINLGHAKVILSGDVAVRDKLCQQIIKKSLSVRATEKLLKDITLSPIIIKNDELYLTDKLEDIKLRLIKIFGNKVKINSYPDGTIMMNIKIDTLQGLEDIVNNMHIHKEKEIS